MPASSAENAIALGLVVLANWLLAHLATSWAMPPEVQSSLQAMIIALLGAWFKTRAAGQGSLGQSSPALGPLGPVVPEEAQSFPTNFKFSQGVIDPRVPPVQTAPVSATSPSPGASK